MTRPSKMHVAVFDACAAGSVFRLPSGEVRQYYPDGTYIHRGGIVGEMLAAGYVQPGAEVQPPQAGNSVWTLVEPTDAGRTEREARNG